jgi:hypothetical protein
MLAAQATAETERQAREMADQREKAGRAECDGLRDALHAERGAATAVVAAHAAQAEQVASLA